MNIRKSLNRNVVLYPIVEVSDARVDRWDSQTTAVFTPEAHNSNLVDDVVLRYQKWSSTESLASV